MADSSTTPVVERAPKKGLRRLSTGLQVAPVFCPAEVADPFDTVTWEVRTAAIKGENGEVLFEQTNCEVPTFWTQLATNVVCSKYYYGEVNTPQREYSVRQLIHRVTRTIADWGIKDGYFATAEDGERFYRELSWLCLHQHGCRSFSASSGFLAGASQVSRLVVNRKPTRCERGAARHRLCSREPVHPLLVIGDAETRLAQRGACVFKLHCRNCD